MLMIRAIWKRSPGNGGFWQFNRNLCKPAAQKLLLVGGLPRQRHLSALPPADFAYLCLCGSRKSEFLFPIELDVHAAIPQQIEIGPPVLARGCPMNTLSLLGRLTGVAADAM